MENWGHESISCHWAYQQKKLMMIEFCNEILTTFANIFTDIVESSSTILNNLSRWIKRFKWRTFCWTLNVCVCFWDAKLYQFGCVKTLLSIIRWETFSTCILINISRLIDCFQEGFLRSMKRPEVYKFFSKHWFRSWVPLKSFYFRCDRDLLVRMNEKIFPDLKQVSLLCRIEWFDPELHSMLLYHAVKLNQLT
jgi:hypothetical protein